MSQATLYSCDFCGKEIGPKKEFTKGLKIQSICMENRGGIEFYLEDICRTCTSKIFKLINNKTLEHLKDEEE